jgi:hypothetical protein
MARGLHAVGDFVTAARSAGSRCGGGILFAAGANRLGANAIGENDRQWAGLSARSFVKFRGHQRKEAEGGPGTWKSVTIRRFSCASGAKTPRSVSSHHGVPRSEGRSLR